MKPFKSKSLHREFILLVFIYISVVWIVLCVCRCYVHVKLKASGNECRYSYASYSLMFITWSVGRFHYFPRTIHRPPPPTRCRRPPRSRLLWPGHRRSPSPASWLLHHLPPRSNLFPGRRTEAPSRWRSPEFAKSRIRSAPSETAGAPGKCSRFQSEAPFPFVRLAH